MKFTFNEPVCKECGKRIAGVFGIGRGHVCDECGATFCKKCASSQIKVEGGKDLCKMCWIVFSLEKLREKK